MFRKNPKEPWTAIGVISYGNFFYRLKVILFNELPNWIYILQPFNKVWDAHEKRNLEFMYESSPTMIGFNPRWALSRVEKINVLLLKCMLTVWWITAIKISYLWHIYDSIKAITVTTEIQRISYSFTYFLATISLKLSLSMKR